FIGIAGDDRERPRGLVHLPRTVGESAENAGDRAAELVDQLLGMLLRLEFRLYLAVLLALMTLAPFDGVSLKAPQRLGDPANFVGAASMRHLAIHVPFHEADDDASQVAQAGAHPPAAHEDAAAG